MNDEDVRVSLFALLLQVRFGCVVAEAARIDTEHVDRRLAFHDPLGKLPAGAAGRRDAETVSFVEPEISLAPGGANDGASIRGVGNRAVVHFLDAGLAEDRH